MAVLGFRVLKNDKVPVGMAEAEGLYFGRPYRDLYIYFFIPSTAVLG